MPLYVKGAANIPFEIAFIAGNPVTWSNQPAAVTELAGGSTRRKIADLTNATEARLIYSANVVSFAGAKLRAQYSVNSGANWDYLDGVSGPEVGMDTANAPVASAWVTLVAAAKTASTWLRIVGLDGDGTADPAMMHVALQVR